MGLHEQSPRPASTPESNRQEVQWPPRERLYFETVYRATTSLGETAEEHLNKQLNAVLREESELLDYEHNEHNPNVEKGCQRAATKWLTSHPASENAHAIQNGVLHVPFGIHVAFLLETGAVEWLNRREETKAAQLEAFQQKRKMTIIRNLEPLVRNHEVEYTAAREIVMDFLPQVAMSKKRREELARLWSIMLPKE